MAKYKRELSLPTYPISLDEIYDRADKYSQSMLRRPIFSVEEDEDDIVPQLGGDFSRFAGLGSRSRLTEKRLSVAVSHRHTARTSPRDRRRSVATDFQSKRMSISPSTRESEDVRNNAAVSLMDQLPSELLKKLPSGR